MLMKTNLEIKPQTSLKTKTIFVLKITAVVGMLGIVLTAAFFIISYFGTPKTSLADDDHDQNKNNVLGNTIIISEYGSKGHNGQQRDEYIELYNLTSSAINLSGYKLQYYQNNSSAKTVYLSGTIQADDYFVIAVRNGKNSNSQPTNNLSYDFIVPSPGWSMNGQGYLKLYHGNTKIDNAGSSNDKFLANVNYDRTDVLVDGGSSNSDWTEVDYINSTPGAINISDLPTVISVNTMGVTVNFGSNSNNKPAISIKSQGTTFPGAVTVKVDRGKAPNSTIQMIKRSVDIDPTVQPDNVELVFYYHESELNGLAENDLALYSYYNNQWHFIGGAVDTLNNKITATGVNHFSQWSAGLNSNGSLPVSLLSFEGEFSGESVIINWKTATEENNDFFTIEHSQDGINFEQIGTQIGAGNSNSIIQYTLKDDYPFDELTYYRLKQTDYDGKFEYFAAIAVRNNTTSNNITIEKYGPNPFINEVNIQMNSNIMGTVLVKLYNIQGTLLRTMDYQCQKGQNTFVLGDLGELFPGTYLVQICSDSYSTEAIRLIKH